jgi:hypothetical protein
VIEPTIQPFYVKDCALITLATGLRAQNLREMRDKIEQCPLPSIEYHFFSSQLRPSFDDPEFHNDFAIWARRSLHDRVLAERLGVLDPLQYRDLESLRVALLDVVEDRLSESEHVPWAVLAQEFIFLRAQTVVFDTGLQAKTPRELARLIPHLSTGSVYYHFVEARRRVPGGVDDFRAWMERINSEIAELRERLAAVDYYFVSLTELRERLAQVFADVLFREHAGGARC